MTSSDGRARAFVVITFAVYAALTLYVTLHHEPWCDEADSWLLMRDGGVGTMLSRTGYAGTPALWYLLIAPFAKLGLPYTAQALLNLALAWSAALVFLVLAPFPRLLKVLFLFSYYMSYEYSVLARPYALMVLLMFGIAACRDRPMARAVLIALLANTTSHGLIIAAVLALICGAPAFAPAIRARNNAGRNAGVPRGFAPLVMLVGLLLAAWQLRVPPDGPPVLRHIDPQSLSYAIGSAFTPGVGPRTAFALGIVVIVAVIAALDRRTLFFFVLSTVALLLLFVFVWLGGLRHTGLILILAITALWMSSKNRLVANVMLCVSLALSIPAAARNWIADVRQPYSAGEEMGRHIVSQGLDREEIAAHPTNETKSVFAFVPKKRFWFPATARYGTYSSWDRVFEQEQATRVETALERAAVQLHGKKPLFLTTVVIPERFPCRMQYVTKEPLRTTERFYLYRCEF